MLSHSNASNSVRKSDLSIKSQGNCSSLGKFCKNRKGFYTLFHPNLKKKSALFCQSYTYTALIILFADFNCHRTQEKEAAKAFNSVILLLLFYC